MMMLQHTLDVASDTENCEELDLNEVAVCVSDVTGVNSGFIQASCPNTKNRPFFRNSTFRQSTGHTILLTVLVENYGPAVEVHDFLSSASFLALLNQALQDQGIDVSGANAVAVSHTDVTFSGMLI